MSVNIPDDDMNKLKKKVLKQQYQYLVENLGDPSRYMPYMISGDILDFSDTETIRSKVTSKEKGGTFVKMLMDREAASAFDEFVEALLQERVQSHIARKLQQALRLEIENANFPPAPQTNDTDEELISSVASISLTDSCHSVNEEVTPCVDAITDGHGPKPPPPPVGSLIKNSTDLLPPLNPTAEANLGSYNTQPMDHMHMQESYALDSEYSLKRENEELRMENDKLKSIVQRLQDEISALHNESASQTERELRSKVQRLKQENLTLLNQNTLLQQRLKESGMPVPEQNTGSRKQSEMVPKGSGTY